ncbi:MAG: DUF6152 family protein [Candidatus Rariloculaceae bacterium]
MRNLKSLEFVLSGAIFALIASVPAVAHHSSMYFDMDAEIAHDNVRVLEFEVANPHGFLIYVVTDGDGNEVEWTAELPSANFTRRAGIDGSLLSPGDTLDVVGWPGRGERTRDLIMRLNRAELPNGDVATFTAISATLTRPGAE